MEHTRISHYQLGRRLGRGGMGEVYEATDLDLDRRVALKFVAPELAAEPDAMRRFEREARSAAALSHPNIATVYAFERVDGVSFIAMELMSGESLRGRMARGRLDLREALVIARDVAAGLAQAHRRGVAHRDIKPENVMFDFEGVAKITDFGLAKAAQASRLTMTGSSLGTAAYMAPESLRGEAGQQGDVFALGCMLHEMIVGTLPFAGDNPLSLMYTIANEPPKRLREQRPDVPEAIEALVLRLLAKDPAERPDAPTVVRELSALLGQPVPELPAAAPSGGGAAGTGPDTAADSSIRTRALTPMPGTEELEAERVGVGSPERALVTPPAKPAPARRGGRVALALGLVLVLGGGTAGFLAWRAGQAREARARATQLNNQGVDLLANDADGARRSFEAAVAADPSYGAALVNLGMVRERDGQAAQAESLYRAALRRPDTEASARAAAHYNLGLFELASHNHAAAARELTTSLSLDSSRAEPYSALGYALVLAEDPGRALAVLERGIARFATAPTLHKNAGLAELRLGRAEAALARLDRALELNPRLLPARALRARSLERLGRSAEAAREAAAVRSEEQAGLPPAWRSELEELRTAGVLN